MKRTVLFLCSFNIGRSIMAECLLNAIGGDFFEAYSAGEAPRSDIHPQAAATLVHHGHSLSGLKPKSWASFLAADGPSIDLAITLCNNAEGEMCLALSERFPVAHWDIPDPALATAVAERAQLFEAAYQKLKHLIEGLTDLPGDYFGQRLADAATRLGFICDTAE